MRCKEQVYAILAVVAHIKACYVVGIGTKVEQAEAFGSSRDIAIALVASLLFNTKVKIEGIARLARRYVVAGSLSGSCRTKESKMMPVEGIVASDLILCIFA
ncbi:hypothetical protein F5Y18DRAFT_433296 [Xylariaceae sp. FL1019]|nr:hypothetical protein F5Y18DRAFT_433296 [Xylariaceae sp. FL1019]